MIGPEMFVRRTRSLSSHQAASHLEWYLDEYLAAAFRVLPIIGVFRARLAALSPAARHDHDVNPPNP